MKRIRWGIIGLGKIANKFAKDLVHVCDAELYAVASRDLEKAEEFAKIHGSVKAYGSYEELMKDDKVDVIYIATPHSYHHQLSLDCLRNKKAVLCEKPIALNSQQVEEMIAVARNENTFLMEALWTKFLPHYSFVQQIIDEDKYGRIKSLNADFGFPAEFDLEKRLFNKKLGGGSLLDIGIYPVFAACSFLGNPEKVTAQANFANTEVDAECFIKLEYKNGASANLRSSFLEKTPTMAIIELEDANIQIHSRFHEPTSVSILKDEKEEIFHFDVETTGYNFEAQHVNEMLKAGRVESNIMSHQHSLELIKLLDRIREDIGLNY